MLISLDFEIRNFQPIHLGPRLVNIALMVIYSNSFLIYAQLVSLAFWLGLIKDQLKRNSDVESKSLFYSVVFSIDQLLPPKSRQGSLVGLEEHVVHIHGVPVRHACYVITHDPINIFCL